MALSESLSHGHTPYRGVPENDDLGGAKVGLKTGYGQTKWVSEKLLFEAGRRGLRGHILRAGYVVGDSHTGGGYYITLLDLITDFGIKSQILTTLSGAWSRAVFN